MKDTDAQFVAWRDSLPAKHWAKYDLSACKLGWDAAMHFAEGGGSAVGGRVMTAEDEDMGSWLVACLDDPTVCTEMKLCVTRWMEQFDYTRPARSGVVSDEDVRDAARYRWLKGQKTSQEILAYIVFTKDVDHAIDAAIQGERHDH